MRWYKFASDHGDTLHGQHLADERERVSRDVATLRDIAMSGDVGVLSRWAGEIRRRMLLLPPAERVSRMCMRELSDLSTKLASIRGDMSKYSVPKNNEMLPQ
jgi:hypothetical protein